MQDEANELKQLNTGYLFTFIIWVAILGSLGIYLVVSKIAGFELQGSLDSNLPIETIKYVFFAVSFGTIFIVYYLRKFLLRVNNSFFDSILQPRSQHPAVAKYRIAILVTSSLLESIGLYGFVLFILTKDTMSLYLLLIISAAAMIYFRPCKDELLSLASEMKAQSENRPISH
jgi:hypothetical protein